MTIEQATTRPQRAECFHAHLAAVAAKMQGFVYQPKIDKDAADWLASGELVSGAQRATLYVSLHLGDYNNKTPYRAECCGIYPTTDQGERYPSYGEERPSIKFQLTRPAEQIAADITRRLLPAYQVFFAKVAKWVHCANAAAALLTATRDKMKEAGFSFAAHSQNEGQMLFARGEKLDSSRPYVYVYGGHVDLKLKNLSPERVLAVLDVLDLTPEARYV